jgi:hypothetical protein
MYERTYAERRRSLLIELRVMRRTNPSKRIVKHMQTLMRKLRTARRLGVVK